MIDFAGRFHIKKPGSMRHKLFARVHRASNAMTLFPRAIHDLDVHGEPGRFDLADAVRDPAEIRLAVLSDLHLPRWRALDRLHAAIGEVRALDPRPDAVIVAGDITEGGSERSYRMFETAMEGLGDIPFFTIPGNHDLRGLMRNRYQSRFGGALDYSIDFGGMRMLCLGSCDHCVQEETLAWVDAELAARPRTPHMILIHFHPLPILNFSSSRAIGQWLDSSLLDNTDDLMHTLLGRGNAVAIFHGHTHLSVHQRFHGLDVVGVGSISAHQPGQTNRPSYRLVTFAHGEMETATKLVGGPLLANEAIHIVDDLYRVR